MFIAALLLAGVLHAENSITLAVVGDIKFAKTTADMVAREGTQWAFAAVKDELDDADFRIANLESTGGPSTLTFCVKEVYFRGPLNQLQALKDGGFDLVSLANNHALDYGPENLIATRNELDRLGIKHVGSALNNKELVSYQVLTAHGLSVAVLGFCAVCPPEFNPTSASAGVWATLPTYFEKAIKEAKRNADFVVVLPHWGVEYARTYAYQENLGQRMRDVGADAVIGCHAHVPQDIAEYHGGFVAYGLGSFFFGTRFQAAWDSLLLKVRLELGKKPAIQLIPINSKGRPMLATGEQAARILYMARHRYDHHRKHEVPKTQDWTSQPLFLETLW